MNQGDILLVDLNPTIGAEITKVRPVIIVSSNSIGKLPLKIVVPITDWKTKFENADWMTRITPNQTNNLTKISAADSFQVRSISENRFIKQIGKVNTLTMNSIKEALSVVFNFE